MAAAAIWDFSEVTFDVTGSHGPSWISPRCISRYQRNLPPHQIWWRYLNGRTSYGDLCVFKMAVGHHLGFLRK